MRNRGLVAFRSSMRKAAGSSGIISRQDLLKVRSTQMRGEEMRPVSRFRKSRPSAKLIG